MVRTHRPEVENENYEWVLKNSGFPTNCGFDSCLRKILENYQKLQKFYQKNSSKGEEIS